MKKFIFLIISVVFLSILFACNKDNIIENKKESSTELVEPAEINQSATNRATGIEVACIGICDTQESECGMIWDLKNGTVDCSCSGCKMTISNGLAINDASVNEKLTSIAPYFEKHLQNNFGTMGFSLLSIKFDLYDKNISVVHLEYKINGTSEEGSVMYVFNNNSNKENNTGPNIEVNCTGGCDDGDEKGCRERYITSTGDVECTCSGCKMSITHL